jgi:CheY-like chemotaxis protein
VKLATRGVIDVAMQLGPYRLINRIGAGGMGEVWRAEDTRLLRPAAVKVLPEWVSADAEARDRFLREARTAAQLNHPYITTVYGAGEEAGTMYIAMELVNGELLSDAIPRRLPVPEVIRIVRQTAEGLAAAHERSFIHRDIKPDNVIVQRSAVKILDFGIAKHLGPQQAGTLTSAGLILGTPHYMSPEQALGHALDARSDIFSLGIVLFEALTGRPPFNGATTTETLLQIVSAAAPDPRSIAGHLSDNLAAIVRKALHKRREERFQSASELAAALAEISCTEPSRARSPEGAAATQVVRRALIADVDDATRACLREVLTSTGVICDEADNGADAVRLLRDRAYALAFIDLFLPRIDGWGVLDYVHRRRLSAMTRVFVIASGKTPRFSPVDRETITSVLCKPLDADRVERAIADAASAPRRPLAEV